MEISFWDKVAHFFGVFYNYFKGRIKKWWYDLTGMD